MQQRLFGTFRRRAITFAAALGVLLGSAIAFSGWSSRPPLTHQHDDRAVTYGNTKATPDAKVLWETASTTDHLEIISDADVVIAQDANIAWDQTNANGLRVQSTDSASPSEWIRASHNGTVGIVETGSGDIFLAPQNGQLAFPNTTGSGTPRFFIRSGSNNDAGFEIGEVSTTTLRFMAKHSLEQGFLLLGDEIGNQMLVANMACQASDYAIAPTTDPLFGVFSDSCSGVATDQAVTIQHDKTDGVVATLSGDLSLNPAANVRLDSDLDLNGQFVADGASWHSCACNYDSTGPTECVTVQDGDFVSAVIIDITTVWDGDGTLEIGDGGNTTRFVDWQNADLTGLTYKIAASSYVYASADTVDCKAITDTSTQGAGTLFVKVERLK